MAAAAGPSDGQPSESKSNGRSVATTDRRRFQRMREAAGTVFGDIGTSVLYTTMEVTRQTVHLRLQDLPYAERVSATARGGQLLEPNDILGGLSLVFWALIFLTVKYDLLIMRADHRGEGGPFALWGLLKGYTGKVVGLGVVSYLVVAAAGLLAADGIITPPISLLGAYEPLGERWAVIAALVSLFVLFKPQWRGTSRVGGAFGWFMVCVWFPWIALKALPWIFANPQVFRAANPWYAAHFLASFPTVGAMVILGVVVLAITGGEAKYADIGHFARRGDTQVADGSSIAPQDSGRRPVMFTWLYLVLPSLLLNYAGQAAYLLQNGVPPRANTYYALTPSLGLRSVDGAIAVADLVISVIAAFIASQALITGMFSITKQAMALGFSPRYAVRFTSREAEGQVYIPAVNWAMFGGCVLVTLIFRSAGNLAAAYGIAVTGTMAITTMVFAHVAQYHWRWSLAKVIAICAPILVVDLAFFGSSLLKIANGGYVPVLIAVCIFLIMVTWQWGRRQFAQAFYDFGVREGKKVEWLVSLRDMLDDIQLTIEQNLPLARSLIQGRRRLVESDRAAVFLCSRPVRSVDDYLPVTLRVFLKKYGVLPSHVVFFHVNQVSVAEADRSRRYEVIRLGNDIDSVIATYGYMEQPDIRAALRELVQQGKLHIVAERWIVQVGEEDIIVGKDLSLWQQLRIDLFGWTLRLSTPAHRHFGLTYDAAISKEIIPVVFSRAGAKVALPELEVEVEEAAAVEPARPIPQHGGK